MSKYIYNSIENLKKLEKKISGRKLQEKYIKDLVIKHLDNLNNVERDG